MVLQDPEARVAELLVENAELHERLDGNDPLSTVKRVRAELVDLGISEEALVGVDLWISEREARHG